MKPAQAGESLLQALYNLPSTHTGTPMHFGILLPLHNHLKNQQRVQGSWEKTTELQSNCCVCRDLTHLHSQCSLEQGERPGWAQTPPPPFQPSPGNEAQPRESGNGCIPEQAQSPGVFLTLLCPPRESWNAWEGP